MTRRHLIRGLAGLAALAVTPDLRALPRCDRDKLLEAMRTSRAIENQTFVIRRQCEMSLRGIDLVMKDCRFMIHVPCNIPWLIITDAGYGDRLEIYDSEFYFQESAA